MKAVDILHQASRYVEGLDVERDTSKERSMDRAVRSFNMLTGNNLSAADGWLFMVVLNLARATAGRLADDDPVDSAACCELALEAEQDLSIFFNLLIRSDLDLEDRQAEVEMQALLDAHEHLADRAQAKP